MEMSFRFLLARFLLVRRPSTPRCLPDRQRRPGCRRAARCLTLALAGSLVLIALISACEEPLQPEPPFVFPEAEEEPDTWEPDDTPESDETPDPDDRPEPPSDESEPQPPELLAVRAYPPILERESTEERRSVQLTVEVAQYPDAEISLELKVPEEMEAGPFVPAESASSSPAHAKSLSGQGTRALSDRRPAFASGEEIPSTTRPNGETAPGTERRAAVTTLDADNRESASYVAELKVPVHAEREFELSVRATASDSHSDAAAASVDVRSHPEPPVHIVALAPAATAEYIAGSSWIDLRVRDSSQLEEGWSLHGATPTWSGPVLTEFPKNLENDSTVRLVDREVDPELLELIKSEPAIDPVTGMRFPPELAPNDAIAVLSPDHLNADYGAIWLKDGDGAVRNIVPYTSRAAQESGFWFIEDDGPQSHARRILDEAASEDPWPRVWIGSDSTDAVATDLAERHLRRTDIAGNAREPARWGAMRSTTLSISGQTAAPERTLVEEEYAFDLELAVSTNEEATIDAVELVDTGCFLGPETPVPFSEAPSGLYHHSGLQLLAPPTDGMPALSVRASASDSFAFLNHRGEPISPPWGERHSETVPIPIRVHDPTSPVTLPHRLPDADAFPEALRYHGWDWDGESEMEPYYTRGMRPADEPASLQSPKLAEPPACIAFRLIGFNADAPSAVAVEVAKEHGDGESGRTWVSIGSPVSLSVGNGSTSEANRTVLDKNEHAELAEAEQVRFRWIFDGEPDHTQRVGIWDIEIMPELPN